MDCPRPRRPDVGFTLDDGEMLVRLGFLYGAERAERIRESWELLRRRGNGFLVEREKARHCWRCSYGRE